MSYPHVLSPSNAYNSKMYVQPSAVPIFLLSAWILEWINYYQISRLCQSFIYYIIWVTSFVFYHILIFKYNISHLVAGTLKLINNLNIVQNKRESIDNVCISKFDYRSIHNI